ncbi:MAG: hypothetical protein H6Q67_1473 [Firmicutes bacterium]|nr:hypothetical protein [Bacillota bacterium]
MSLGTYKTYGESTNISKVPMVKAGDVKSGTFFEELLGPTNSKGVPYIGYLAPMFAHFIAIAPAIKPRKYLADIEQIPISERPTGMPRSELEKTINSRCDKL